MYEVRGVSVRSEPRNKYHAYDRLRLQSTRISFKKIRYTKQSNYSEKRYVGVFNLENHKCSIQVKKEKRRKRNPFVSTARDNAA